MKLRVEIDLDGIKGDHEMVSKVLLDMGLIIGNGAWDDDVRTLSEPNNELRRAELRKRSDSVIWARVEVLDEAFDAKDKIDEVIQIIPLGAASGTLDRVH